MMRHETSIPVMTAEELASLGAGKIAYMRKISGKEIAEAFPNSMEIAPEVLVWALFAADGTPLALADDAGGALSMAFTNDLVPVAIH
ncbi:MAG: DUF1150 family protein [Nitratireductor sp.]